MSEIWREWSIMRETYRPKPVRRRLRAEQRRDVIRWRKGR